MKKIFCLCFVLLLAFAITACKQSTESSASPTVSTPITELTPGNTTDVDDENEDEGNPDEIDIPSFSGVRNEKLVEAFTPEDAEVYTDVESSLIFKSGMSMSDMIEFCLAAADEIGAQQVEIDESRAGYWVYTGTYGENLTLSVELRDDGDSVSALVEY